MCLLLQLFTFLATEVYKLITMCVFFFAFSVDKNTKGPFQNPLCYASASCSEIHSMVPNIYQKTALRKKKKKKRLTETNVVPPSTGRHIELNKRKNNPIILYHKVKQSVYTKRLLHTQLFAPHNMFSNIHKFTMLIQP